MRAIAAKPNTPVPANAPAGAGPNSSRCTDPTVTRWAARQPVPRCSGTAGAEVATPRARRAAPIPDCMTVQIPGPGWVH